MEIKNTFKSLRKQANLTQVELAKKSGVGLRFVRNVEQGKKTMRMDKVNKVLSLFGYHLEAVRNEKE
ncbi:MAG: type II toxin-antitoxin system Y4mF family antitoxin [bacterium]